MCFLGFEFVYSPLQNFIQPAASKSASTWRASTPDHRSQSQPSIADSTADPPAASSTAKDAAFSWGDEIPHVHAANLLRNESTYHSVPTSSSGPWAIVSSFVISRKAFFWKLADLVIGALVSRCSAMLEGSQAQFILLAIALEDDQWADLLRFSGWHIRNMTPISRFLQRLYKPVYNVKAATKLNRRWPNNTIVQQRHDGWATYLKYFAWLEKYERVLVADTDVRFSANPDQLFRSLGLNKTFLTVSYSGKERAGMGLGIHSFFHLIRPSARIFDELANRSYRGDYLPWTNTEQDVLEANFPPSEYSLQATYWKQTADYHHGLKQFPCKTRDLMSWRQSKTAKEFCGLLVKECYDKGKELLRNTVSSLRQAREKNS